MNLTLSIDEALAKRARKIAEHEGKTLNGLIRSYLEQLTGLGVEKDLSASWKKVWKESCGNSKGATYTREEIYSGRLDRYGRRD